MNKLLRTTHEILLGTKTYNEKFSFISSKSLSLHRGDISKVSRLSTEGTYRNSEYLNTKIKPEAEKIIS